MNNYTPGINYPGPGDEETWGPCTNDPLDPRTPDVDMEEYQDKINEEIGKLLENDTTVAEALGPDSWPADAYEKLAKLVDEENAEELGKLLLSYALDYLTSLAEENIE